MAADGDVDVDVGVGALSGWPERNTHAAVEDVDPMNVLAEEIKPEKEQELELDPAQELVRILQP